MARVAFARVVLPMAFLLAPTLGVRVWQVCKGIVPEVPSQEAMAADVEVGLAAECSQEYTFDELCNLDMDSFLDTDLTTHTSLFIKAANRRPSSPDGSMAVSTDCQAGNECYVMCTTGSAKMELAEDSGSPPTPSFAASKTDSTPETFKTDCSPKYFSKTQMLADEMFKYRQEYLIAQGVAPGSDTLVCDYKGTDARYARPASASTGLIASPVKLHLRGGGAASQTSPSCTTLASLATMEASMILKAFPVIGFIMTDVHSKTLSNQGKVFKKFVVHHAQWNSSASQMSLRAYAKQQLVIDGKSGQATLTTFTKPTKREEVFNGKDICIEVPQESVWHQPGSSTNALALEQTEQETRLFGTSGSSSLTYFDWTAGL